jgi:NADPH-dependent 2,4-dienoyl-CoA reductase/sulfur reductase-like enzyme
LGIVLVVGDGSVCFLTDASGRAVAVHTASGRVLAADVLVLGLGVRPNVALAEQAGIPLGTSGGVRVDRRQRTLVDGVWSAGDCCESVHRLSGERVVLALRSHAN